MANPTIRVTVVGDSRSLQSALKQSESSLKNLDSTAAKSQASLSKMESGLSSFTKGAALLAGASAISAAFLKVADAAGALQSATAANERVFGAQSATMQEAAKAAQDYGLSQAQYLQTSAKLGAQLQNLGMDQQRAAVSAQSLMRMGENLAAVFGTDVPQAVTAISAALRGEFDPLEQYGVKLTAAKVAAVQSAEGITQAQAVMKLAMEQSAFSVGAAAAAMDTYAGRQRAFAASWDNAQAAIGEGFLPVATAAVDTLGSLANIVGSIPAGVREFAGTVITAAVAVKALQVGMGMLAAKSAAMSAAMTRSQGAFTATIGAYSVDRFSGALTKVGNALPVVGALILGYAEANSYLNDRITEGTVSLEEFGAALAETGQVPAAQFDQITASVQRLSEGTSTLGNVMSMLTLGVGGSLLDKWINADFYAAQTNIDNLNKALTELMAVNPATGAAAVFEMERRFAAAGLSSDHLAGSLVLARAAVNQVGQAAVDSAGQVQTLTAEFDANATAASTLKNYLDGLFKGLEVAAAKQAYSELLGALQKKPDAAGILQLNQAWVAVSAAMKENGATGKQVMRQYDEMRAAARGALADIMNVPLDSGKVTRLLDKIFGKRYLVKIGAEADDVETQSQRAQRLLDNIKQNSPAKVMARWLGGGETDKADRDVNSVRQNRPTLIDADASGALNAAQAAQNAINSVQDRTVVLRVVGVIEESARAAQEAAGSLFGSATGLDRDDFGEIEPWFGPQMRMAQSLFSVLGQGTAASRRVNKTIRITVDVQGNWEAAIVGLKKLEKIAAQTNKQGDPTDAAKRARAVIKARNDEIAAIRKHIRAVKVDGAGYATWKARLDDARAAMRQLTEEITEAVNGVDLGKAWADVTSRRSDITGQIDDLKDKLKEYQRQAAESFNPNVVAYYNRRIRETNAEIADLEKKRTGATLKAELEAQVARTREFYSQLSRLRESGLSAEALAELARQGPEAGVDIARELLADPKLRQTYNKAYRDAADFSKKVGVQLAQDVYRPQIEAITKSIAKLDRMIKRWAARRHPNVKLKLEFTEFVMPKRRDLPAWVTDNQQTLNVDQHVNVTVQGMVADPEGTARAIRRLLRDSANRNGRVEWAA